MDVTGTFFNKLRTLAVTLEKQAEQFKQIFLEDEGENVVNNCFASESLC